MASPLTAVKFHSQLASGADNAAGRIFTYAAGTTTPQATYTTAGGGTPNANPVILDGTGRAFIYLDAALSYKFVCQDSLGASVPDGTVDNWADPGDSLRVDLANSAIVSKGDALYAIKRTFGGAVATTGHAWHEQQPINLKADLGALGDGVTLGTAAFQAALNVGGVIDVQDGTYILGPLTVPVDGTTLRLTKLAILSFPVLGVGVKAITITANSFSIQGGKLQGPAAGVYVANENGIQMIGTSTNARKSGLTVIDVEISNFGGHGAYCQFVDDVAYERNYLHDCGYAGSMFLSCNRGRASGNKIKNISPGTGGNMYGLSFTHDSTNYNTNPNPGTKLATHPFCRGWSVLGNEVSNVNWEGIDCHGGYEMSIIGNLVYATKYGISAPSSSGSALNYAGSQNIVAFNVIDGRNTDGSVSGYENAGYGVNLNGGSVVNTMRTLCHGNTIYRKGVVSNPASGSIQAAYCKGSSITDNTIDQWGGQGIYTGGGVGVKISGNYFGGMYDSADTIGYCIGSDFGTSNHLTIVGNSHDITGGGFAANAGVRLASQTTPILYASGNDFNAAIVPLTGAAYNWLGGQWGNVFTATTGDTAPSVKALCGATIGTLLIPAAAAYTVTNLADGQINQRITLINTGTFNVTLDRTSAVLHGSANQVLQPKYSLTVEKIGSTWYQISQICANG